MRKHRWLRLVAVASVLALALAACGGDDDDDDARVDLEHGRTGRGSGQRRRDARRSVPLLPQSGDLAVIYDALHVPITMAVDEINAAGGVNGKPVTSCRRRRRHRRRTSPPRASRHAADVRQGRRHRRPGVVDHDARHHRQGRRATGVVECSGSNTSAALDRRRGRRLLLPHRAAGQVSRGRPSRSSSSSDGKTKVAILARNDSYGTGFADALEQALTDGGADVIDQRGVRPGRGRLPRRTCSKVVDDGTGRGRRDRFQRRRRQGREGDDRRERRARQGRRSTPRTACRARSSARRSTPPTPAWSTASRARLRPPPPVVSRTRSSRRTRRRASTRSSRRTTTTARCSSRWPPSRPAPTTRPRSRTR